ncbi:antibiotic biosynthesis monooxygenase [Neptunomonas sp. XY-337]|uniref:putative quinol monooxygenase n=1 Tax=Neptunomonas sp. XY-337 TaxID=2561897 RepID=UPI0010AA7D00|nr:antibiotic biosynthesis monooxygenase [Neptunomonas sp. XY-337]
MLHLVATITAKPGQKQQVLDALLDIRDDVLAEAGCYQYLPTIDMADTVARQAAQRMDTITLLEQWESLDHLEGLFQTAHLKAFQQTVEPWLESVSLQLLQPAVV